MNYGKVVSQLWGRNHIFKTEIKASEIEPYKFYYHNYSVWGFYNQ